MATYSSILAWKILWTEEPHRLQSMGLQRVGHNWAATLQKEKATHSSILFGLLISSFPNTICWRHCLFSIAYSWHPCQRSVDHIHMNLFLGCLFCSICLCVSVTQSCLTLCYPMDYSPPGSSVHGILQARILEWVVIPFSKGSSQTRDRTQVSCTADRFFTIWATREAGQ